MSSGSSRRPRLSALSALLVAALTLPAAQLGCSESPTPDSHPPAPSATVASTAAATVTATATATAAATTEPTATAAATTEPAPTATAKATAAASATPTATAKATSKPAASTAQSAAPSTSSTAAASASASASAAPTAVEIAPPAEGSADAIAQKMDAIFTPKKNYSAKFKQKLEQKVSGAKKEATGTLNIERPNKVSFKYDPPNKNRVVSDGTTMKIYVAEDNQMFTSKVDSSAYSGGLAFFMGGLLKTMTFTFNPSADYKDGYVLIGKPRSPNPTYDYVLFYVNKDLLEKGDPNCLERIVIVDAQKNKNRFDFTSASFPASVPADEWAFEPPAGTNIQKN